MTWLVAATIKVYFSTIEKRGCGAMEKFKPTFDLAAFRSAFDRPGGVDVTGSALRGAAALCQLRANMAAAFGICAGTTFRSR